MRYDEWIERERRIRLKILANSPAVQQERMFRVCRACGEICLCHEERCPNCDSSDIVSRILENGQDKENRIRCLYRYNNLRVNHE